MESTSQHFHGVKKSKERKTVALMANAAGSKETAVVIWKSVRPQCFKSIDTSSLPVMYYNQPKSWMTAGILVSVLVKFNRKLSSKDRKIILLMDNTGCHPKDTLKDCFTASQHYLKIATIRSWDKCIMALCFYGLSFCRLIPTLKRRMLPSHWIFFTLLGGSLKHGMLSVLKQLGNDLERQEFFCGCLPMHARSIFGHPSEMEGVMQQTQSEHGTCSTT